MTSGLDWGECRPWHLAAGCAIALEVEAAVVANHEAALEAWRRGKLPTAEPPASPFFVVLDVS